MNIINKNNQNSKDYKAHLRKIYRDKLQGYKSSAPPDGMMGTTIGLNHTFREYCRNTSSKRIGGYLAYGGELNISKLFEKRLLEEVEVYLPVVQDKELLFIKYKEGDELRKNKFGILEPLVAAKPVNRVEANMLDIVLLPCLAADIMGNRLGSGFGYYDRAFARSTVSSKQSRQPMLFSCGYDWQIINRVLFAEEVHDVRMGGWITPHQLKTIGS